MTETDSAAVCEDPIIRYSRKDTKKTVVQVKEHNAYHRRMGCSE